MLPRWEHHDVYQGEPFEAVMAETLAWYAAHLPVHWPAARASRDTTAPRPLTSAPPPRGGTEPAEVCVTSHPVEGQASPAPRDRGATLERHERWRRRQGI